MKCGASSNATCLTSNVRLKRFFRSLEGRPSGATGSGEWESGQEHQSRRGKAGFGG
jgi:hypothetical protein